MMVLFSLTPEARLPPLLLRSDAMSRSNALHDWKVDTAIKKMMANIEATDTKQIVNAIDTKLTLASFSEGSAHNHRLDAALMLLVLRQRIEAEGEDWWKWHKEHFARSRRDTERLLAMASADDPEAAAEAETERNRQYKSTQRAKAATDVSRSPNVVPLVRDNQQSEDVSAVSEGIMRALDLFERADIDPPDRAAAIIKRFDLAIAETTGPGRFSVPRVRRAIEAITIVFAAITAELEA
jgi:hypothetical protein